MNLLRLLPVIISFLLLAAHFFRPGHLVPAGISITILFLLFLREAWVPLVIQIALYLAAFEWMRTMYELVQLRIEIGEPWTRLAIILGAVALFTALSGLVFRSKPLRQRFIGPGPHGQDAE
jgi:hypothetical protein